MMIFVNDATKAMDQAERSQLLRFAQILQPFAPHVAEELWERLGGQGLLARASGRAVDPQAARRRRGRDRRAGARQGARAHRWCRPARPTTSCSPRRVQAVASYLEGKTVAKEIVVPGKLVNFVVR
jgi:leucyl-tRNA synthetase